MRTIFKSMLLLCLAASLSLYAGGDHKELRGDDHAPIGVMGDHTHMAGEWMFSYRFMRMEMSENADGGTTLSTEEVLADYMVAPLEMTMDMHMLGVMYAPSDRLTLMAMAPFVDMSMNHQTRMGMRFTTESSGIGDVSLAAMMPLFKDQHAAFQVQLGVSLPTGSIDERGDTPAMADAQLPYPMQLGSGTYDLVPALTYSRKFDAWSWGAQLRGRYPLESENDRDYRRGDQTRLDLWFAKPFHSGVSLSARFGYQDRGNYHGADPMLNPMMVPTADPNRRGGTGLFASGGLNFVFKNGSLRGHRLALEYTSTLDEDLEGPQLQIDDQLTLGWQFAF